MAYSLLFTAGIYAFSMNKSTGDIAMNISGVWYDQGAGGISSSRTSSSRNREAAAGQTDRSDTVTISEEAKSLSRKDGRDENSGYDSNIADQKKTELDSVLALLKEVGFKEYLIIMKTVRQIETALAKTGSAFPIYKKALEKIGNGLSDELPRSAAEAMSRLNEALKAFPEEVRESVLRHLEAEKKKDYLLAKAEADSGTPLASG